MLVDSSDLICIWKGGKTTQDALWVGLSTCSLKFPLAIKYPTIRRFESLFNLIRGIDGSCEGGAGGTIRIASATPAGCVNALAAHVVQETRSTVHIVCVIVGDADFVTPRERDWLYAASACNTLDDRVVMFHLRSGESHSPSEEDREGEHSGHL